MKEIYSNPSLAICDFIKMLLESEGMKCFLRNEFASVFACTGQWPEIWIANDEEYEKATAIIKGALASKISKPSDIRH